MIRELIQDKNSSEAANIKANEIVKIDFIGQHSFGNYKIGIVEVNKIDGGIELFAKAWDGNKQLGFGDDGSIEIERFRIFNPPILVKDNNGDIILESTNPFTGELKQTRYKESPLDAILETLVHTIKNSYKDGRIISGKIGHTTSTFYPVTGDGVIQGAANSTFSTAHDATTGTLNTSDIEGYSLCRLNGANYQVWRTFQNFDTSSIPDGDTISSVVSSIYGAAVSGASGNHHGVYGSTAADTIVADDFNNGGTTAYSDSPLLDTAFSTVAYNDLTWNATGIAAINKTGITKICYREVEHDVANSAPTVNQFINFYNSSKAGTTNDPKLIVVHAASGTAYTLTASVGSFATTGVNVLLRVAYRITAAVGTFTLTGVAATLRTGFGIVASVGSFILTLFDAPLRNSGWTNRTKPSTTFTDRTKPTTTFTNRTKPTTNWTNR